MDEMKRINDAAEKVLAVCGQAEIGIILGSGLGDYAEALEDAVKLPYSEIPGFPRSTVAGHAGMWCCGTLYGKRVVMMQGRFHYYEGYGMKDVTLPVRVMQKIGVKTLIVTNAAGGVNLGYHPGELMVIGDMFSMTAQNPLIGPNLDAFGPRFPDMSCAFDKELRALAHECANEQGFALRVHRAAQPDHTCRQERKAQRPPCRTVCRRKIPFHDVHGIGALRYKQNAAHDHRKRQKSFFTPGH